MKHLQITKSAALVLSACAAALLLAACNNGSLTQNGAYVSSSTNTAQPAPAQPMPPSSEYQAVSQTPPPPLPVYDQPTIPGPGYVWTPGYWDWSTEASDYYWVPGVWVEPPETGLLWTPGYWRYYDGKYLFSDGYWGPQVGFYGGVDYGYGYGGSGYSGGRWQGDQFYYNSQVNNLGAGRIRATYSQAAPRSGNRVSFNGGPGGLRAVPVQTDFAAAHARHVPPTRDQREHARMAGAQPQLRASVNRGAPPIAAMDHPSAFHAGAGVTAARSVETHTSGARPTAAGAAVRAAPRVGRIGETRVAPTRSAAPAEGSPARAAERPQARARATPSFAPPPSRPESRIHVPAMHAPARPQAAPQQHAPQIRAASPRPAPHPAAPKPPGGPDRPR